MFGVVASLALLATAASASSPVALEAPHAARQAAVPLASQHFTWGKLPYKADPSDGLTGSDRGPQSGYNICNSTTEGPTSQCQTAILNSASDFCLWGPPVPNSDVGDTEGQSVAWCSLPGHGTRVIPSGALTGVQFMKTPGYVQVTGFINQAEIDMDPNDGGGEMDPHGADNRGNPIGGLVFTNAFPASNGNANNYIQAIEWHNFMGSGVFCFKACDPTGPNPAALCQHLFDRIGCEYNAPAAYVDGVFESCLGENQDPPGVYTGADGKTTTYQQPAESLGPISTMPYSAVIPASSQCTTYASSALYSGQPAAVAAATTAGTSTTALTTAAAVTPIASAKPAVTSAAATTSAAASGASSVFGVSGVWAIAVGVVGAAMGALVVL